jgi:hypothetical protein
VYFSYRFDSSDIVFNQLISGPSCELVHLPLSALNSFQFCSNIIALGLGSSPSHQLQVSSFNLQVPSFEPRYFSLYAASIQDLTRCTCSPLHAVAEARSKWSEVQPFSQSPLMLPSSSFVVERKKKRRRRGEGVSPPLPVPSAREPKHRRRRV